jgi:anhydro-N-acetylmuramic acid kinase
MPFDLAGASACRGHVDDARAAAIADAIKSVAAGHRSLGSGDEGREILSHVASMSSADDRLATVVDGLARVIAGAIPDATRRVIVAGGGGHNRALMNAMSRHHQHTLTPSPEVGIELHAREPVAMAILGLLALDGVVVTLPQVTGRKVAISFDGSWCRPPPFK